MSTQYSSRSIIRAIPAPALHPRQPAHELRRVLGVAVPEVARVGWCACAAWSWPCRDDTPRGYRSQRVSPPTARLGHRSAVARVDWPPMDSPTPFAHASEAEMARILDFYEVRWEYDPTRSPSCGTSTGPSSRASRPISTCPISTSTSR
jgi:hypothetical protein